MEPNCHECERTLDDTHLSKCPICFQHFCEDHSYNMSGRTFCSRGCAQEFFFGEPDD